MLRSGGVTIAAGLVIDVSSWCVLNSANTTPPAPKWNLRFCLALEKQPDGKGKKRLGCFSNSRKQLCCWPKCGTVKHLLHFNVSFFRFWEANSQKSEIVEHMWSLRRRKWVSKRNFCPTAWNCNCNGASRENDFLKYDDVLSRILTETPGMSVYRCLCPPFAMHRFPVSRKCAQKVFFPIHQRVGQVLWPIFGVGRVCFFAATGMCQPPVVRDSIHIIFPETCSSVLFAKAVRVLCCCDYSRTCAADQAETSRRVRTIWRRERVCLSSSGMRTSGILSAKIWKRPFEKSSGVRSSGQNTTGHGSCSPTCANAKSL